MLKMTHPPLPGRRQCTRHLSRPVLLFLTRSRKGPSRRKNIPNVAAHLLYIGGVTRKSARRQFLRAFGEARNGFGSDENSAVGRALSCVVPRLTEKELVEAIRVVGARKLPNKNLREILGRLLNRLGSDAGLLAATCRAVESCDHVKDQRQAQICMEALAVHLEELNLPAISAFCTLGKFQPKMLLANEGVETTAEMMTKMCEIARKNPEADFGIFRDIMVAAGRLGVQPSEEMQHFLAVKISDGISEIRAVRELLQIADAAQRQGCVDYCLLHDVAREAVKLIEKMEIGQLSHLMGIFARQEVYDGEFLERARERLLCLLAIREKVGMSGPQMLNLMTVVSRLNTSLDPEQEVLNLLCMRAKELIPTFSEINITQLLLAVQKRRPVVGEAVHELMDSVMSRDISAWSPCSAATTFCALSKLSHFSEELAVTCLTVVNKKGVSKLGGAQSQQLLAVLSHHAEEIPKGLMKTTLKALVDNFCRPALTSALNQVQTVAVLTAFAKLGVRQEFAIVSLIRSLTTEVDHKKGGAKLGKNLSSLGTTLPPRTFDLARTVENLTLENQLDPAHWTSILAAVEGLSAWSPSTAHLCLILRSLMLHHGLQGLRAIHIAQAMKPFCHKEWRDLASNDVVSEIDEEVEGASQSLSDVNGQRFDPGGPDCWLAEFGHSCLSALLRHEVYLISTWSVLTAVRSVLAEFGEACSIEWTPGEAAFLHRLAVVESEEAAADNRARLMVKDGI
ncbi:hypothetical protein FOZ60_008831 [Perkinsus olseni]|uniref:Uncharacterized protein n=1 Tax=Perkinsus olseni TaxID=32597 RepID=A0A7J6NKL0_PEROL|nr:hypothetical protein FOZ60_008831 [Perkinsus olseni]